MKLLFNYNNKAIESKVFAMFEMKKFKLFKKKCDNYYLVLVPSGDIFRLEFIDEKNVIRVIDVKQPEEWIKERKFKSIIKYVVSMTVFNFHGYEWILEDRTYLCNIDEDNAYCRTKLYKELPYLINQIYRIEN